MGVRCRCSIAGTWSARHARSARAGAITHAAINLVSSEGETRFGASRADRHAGASVRTRSSRRQRDDDPGDHEAIDVPRGELGQHVGLSRRVSPLLQTQKNLRRPTISAIAGGLSQPASEIEPASLQSADARLLEEEVFLGCTQAMLLALDREQRIAFVLGGVCDVPAADAAYALGLTEVAFRKRLSRARATLDFMARRCGIADPCNPCRCAYQVNHRVGKGLLDLRCLRYAASVSRTSLETLRARRELAGVRRSLELYRAQPEARAPEDFAARVRALIAKGNTRLFDA